MEVKKNSLESGMHQLPSFDSNIAAIYFMANSSRSLLKMLRDNFFISETLSSYSSQILIDEFNKKISTPIESSEGIANVYAILVALTFKDKSEVIELFKKVSKTIKFEWFSEIANIYLNDFADFPSYKVISEAPQIQANQVIVSSDNFVFNSSDQ